MSVEEVAHVLLDWLKEHVPDAVGTGGLEPWDFDELNEERGPAPADFAALVPIAAGVEGLFPDGGRLPTGDELDAEAGDIFWPVVALPDGRFWYLRTGDAEGAELRDPDMRFLERSLEDVLRAQLQALSSGALKWHAPTRRFVEHLPDEAFLPERLGIALDELVAAALAEERAVEVAGLGRFVVTGGQTEHHGILGTSWATSDWRLAFEDEAGTDVVATLDSRPDFEAALPVGLGSVGFFGPDGFAFYAAFEKQTLEAVRARHPPDRPPMMVNPAAPALPPPPPTVSSTDDPDAPVSLWQRITRLFRD